MLYNLHARLAGKMGCDKLAPHVIEYMDNNNFLLPSWTLE